jgi:hypothetical protein
VIRPFWFITTRSFKNRILQRLRRLRNPRYLISFIAGLAYLWFMVFRRMFFATARHGPAFGFSLPVKDVFVDVMAMFVGAVLLLAWAWPEQSGGLRFSEAEIQFLFPAPVSRRALLLYKVFRQQPQILISATMMTIFGFRQAHFVGLWIPFVFLSAYFTMVALARARLKLMRIGFTVRVIAVSVIGTAIASLFVKAFHTAGLSSAQIQSAPALFRAVVSPLQAPVVRAILFIPRFFASAVLPPSFGQQALSCAVLLVMAAICLALASQLNVSFEEASLHASERQQARIARVRGQRSGRYVMFRRMPPPFRLPPSAPPELAILWKNLIAAFRISTSWIAFIGFIALILLIPNMITRHDHLRVVGAMMALGFCGFFPFAASQMFSQDLRLDLPDMELLKSYPITGERLVAAEIAAPLLLISIVQMIMLSLEAFMTSHSHVSGTLAFFGTPQFVVVGLLFTVPICAAQLVIRNAVVVLLPGWAVRSAEDQRGFVVVGQRLVMLVGNIIVLTLALLPAALLFIPAFLLSRAYFSGSAAVLAIATVPSVALLAFEVWMAIRFLGAQFDKVDVTTEVGVATI